VFLVGKDFGVRPAYFFSILHPERVLGVITLGIPYVPPRPSMYHKFLPEGFYILRWQVNLISFDISAAMIGNIIIITNK
jgi:hypothetical protein